MQTKKINFDDFEAVTVEELLHTKGGSFTEPVGGPCAGDPNGFGGYNDADEVVVSATGPRTYTSVGTSTSVVTSGLGRVMQFFSSIPGMLLSTQGLNMSEPWSAGYHWDPTSNCGGSGGSPVNKPPYDPFTKYAL